MGAKIYIHVDRRTGGSNPVPYEERKSLCGIVFTKKSLHQQGTQRSHILDHIGEDIPPHLVYIQH